MIYRFPSAFVLVLAALCCGAPIGSSGATAVDDLTWLTTTKGVRALPLSILAGAYGWVPVEGPAPAVGWRTRLRRLFQGGEARYLRVADGRNQLGFSPGSRRLLFNQRVVWMNGPILQDEGRWVLAEDDVRGVVGPLLRPEEYLRGRDVRVVVLDPGHGGTDEGARSGDGLLEKDVVLDLAKRLRVHLVNAGLEVRMTRTNDRKIDLSDRCRMAATWNADLFVSIHVNKAANTGAKGLETYVLPAPGRPSTSAHAVKPGKGARQPGNTYDAASMVLGWCLHDALLAKTSGTDRGIKRARFVVLREAPCPAALVECGFLSNSDEAALLGAEAYRADLAAALAHGILDYTGVSDRARLSQGE